MSMKPFSRIRCSVCALSLLLLVLAWGYFGISFRRDHQSITAHSGQHLQSVALGLEEYVRHLFHIHDMVLTDTIDHLLLAEPLSLIQLRLDDWMSHLPQLRGVRLVAVESGEVLLEVGTDPSLRLNKIIPLSAESPGDATLPLQVAAERSHDQAGEKLVVIWREVKIDGRHLQVIALLRTNGLRDFYRLLELDEQASIAILHDSGGILAHEPLSSKVVGQPYAAPAFGSDIRTHSVGLAQLPVTVDGDKRLVAYRKMATLPLTVAVSASNESLFKGWNLRLRDFLIILLVVSLAILSVTFMLVRALSKIELAEDRLHEREKHFRSVADSTVDAVISVDTEQRVQFWSQGAERTFDVPSSAAQGQLLSKFLHFSGDLSLQQTLGQLAALGALQQSGGTFEVQGIRCNRWIFPTELSVSAGTSGGKPFYTLIVRDVTDRKAMEEHIRRLASHDNLTRLPNRSLLMDRLQVAMAQVRRQGGQFALLFLDLDEFKPVNDCHGHDVGDLLLQQVAERLETTVRESDTVARVGGDEFAILLTNVVETETITVACRNILKALNREFVLNGNSCRIGGSIGAVLYTGQDITGSELMRLADMAMYAAKEAGKNRYVFAHAEDKFPGDGG